MPLTVWLFANYVLEHGLYRITPKDLELALGLHNKEAKYQVIHTLLDYDLIKPIANGLYEVNVDVAEYIVRLIPHPAGRRVYSNQWRRETLPDWRTADQRYRQWLNAVMYVTQGTNPPIADWAQFPAAYLRVPSGHCVPTIMVAGMYIIPTKSLARRTTVYCVDIGPVTICSPTPGQLIRYLNPPCPECAPVVPYPTPCEPKVEGLVADFKSQLIPLSSLPRTARRYEPGVVFTPGKSLGPHPYDLFNVELSRRGGHPPHLRVVPREGVVKDYIGSDPWQVCQAVEALADFVLAYALSNYQALAGYGSSLTGLPASVLISKSEEVFAQAYQNRRRKPRVSPSLLPPKVYLRNVMVEVSKYDRQSHRRRKEQITLDSDGPITCRDLRAKVARRASMGSVRVLYFELWVFLPDRDGSLSKDLAVEYDYIYHNAEKDRPGTVRLEARPYSGVTSSLGPQDIITHLYAKAYRIATALKVAMLARHSTDLP